MTDFGNQPWTVFHSPGEEYFAVVDSEGIEILTLYYGNLGDEPLPGERAQAEKRLHLFRSAPALLAALAELTEAFNTGRLLSPYGPVLTRARAAVALARGEPQ